MRISGTGLALRGGNRSVSEAIVQTIQLQTKVLLDNIQTTLDYCDDSLMEKSFPTWPVWKQFYHLLHSLDEWFIDPVSFKEPSMHQPYFRTSDSGPEKLTRGQVGEYFKQVRARIESYLNSLTASLLLEHVGKGDLTRLDLILIQFRHVMHHIGYLHCAIKNETGESPKYIGFKPQW